MAEQLQDNIEQPQDDNIGELIDPDAICYFIHPVTRLPSKEFNCRTTIDLLGDIWWIGTAEVAIAFDQLERFREESLKERLFTFIVRIKTKEFSGYANVVKTLVQDEVVTIFFNGLTSTDSAC